MNLLFQFFCVTVVISSTVGQVYNTNYDDLDVDMVLKSNRLLNNYIKCILDEGPCTPEGKELRRNIPDAITTNCSRCSKAQINIIKKVSKHIMTNRPQDWNKIRKKFDPRGKYQIAFEKFLNNQQ